MAPTSAQDLDYPRRLIQTCVHFLPPRTKSPRPSLITQQSQNLTPRLDGHQGAVNCVRYNHGAKYVLTASSDRSVRLWNPSLAKEIKAYRGHAQEVLHVDMCVCVCAHTTDISTRASADAQRT